jgi:hypothetical protein
MTSTDDITTVRLSGRDGLLTAIPAMLGFHPAESLVVACLAGPRQRLGPVVRVDLRVDTDRSAGEPLCAEDLRRYAHQYADQVALVCYTSALGRPLLLDEVESALVADGADIVDVVVVRGGYAYPAGPGGEFLPRVPLPGPDHPQVQLMTAASALRGRVVLPDREALRTSVAGPTGTAARAAALTAMQGAADRLIGVIGASGPPDRAALRRLRDNTIERALQAAGTTGTVLPVTAAVLALLANDVRTRDHLVARAVRETDRPWLAMLLAVARSNLDVDAAQICAVLALTAYARGDGALAQVAIDRCLEVVPDHRLAELMVDAMAAGMPPAALLGLTESSVNPDMDG